MSFYLDDDYPVDRPSFTFTPLRPSAFQPPVREDQLYNFSRTSEQAEDSQRAIIIHAVGDFLADRLDEPQAIRKHLLAGHHHDYHSLKWVLSDLLKPLFDVLKHPSTAPKKLALGLELLFSIWAAVHEEARAQELQIVEAAVQRLKASTLAPRSYATVLFLYDVQTKAAYPALSGGAPRAAVSYTAAWSSYPTIQTALDDSITAQNPGPLLALLDQAQVDGRLAQLNQFFSDNFRSFDSIFCQFVEMFAHLFQHASDEVACRAIWALMDHLQTLDANTRRETLWSLQDISSHKVIAYFYTCFAQGYYQSSTPSEFFDIAKTLSGLYTISTRAPLHYYMPGGQNAHDSRNIYFNELLVQAGLEDRYLFQEGLPFAEFRIRIEKFRQFLALVLEEKHREAKTLKALCHFTPRANPAFRLCDAPTFDIALGMLQSASDQPALNQALMLLDIFTPADALRLFTFYQKQRANLSIDVATFRPLPDEEKVEWLYYHSRMRTRQTKLALWVIRHSSHNEPQLILALEWLTAVKRELKPRDVVRLLELMQRGSLAVQQTLVATFSATHKNEKDESSRDMLIQKWLVTNDVKLLELLIRAISFYQFDEARDQAHFAALLSKINTFASQDRALIHASTFALMRIVACGIAATRNASIGTLAFDQMLLYCKKMVDSDAWSEWDKDYAADNSSTHLEHPKEAPHLQYPIPQAFERNRYRMNIAILHLFTKLYPQPVHLLNLDSYLKAFGEHIYYIPFLHLPDGTSVYRSLGSKQGQPIISQHAVVDALLSGCFARDLYFGSHDHGNWSKRQEDLSGCFLTSELAIAINPLYYNPEDGALLEASASSINSESMAVNSRMEREQHYNMLLFGGRSRHQFERIYLSDSWKSDLFAIAGRLPETAAVAQFALADTSKNPELRSALVTLQSYLMQKGTKEVFKKMSLRELFELHRHLTKENFIDQKILFGVDPKTLPQYALDSTHKKARSLINSATTERMSQMQSFRHQFEAFFKTPFCLGQDQMLGLPVDKFVTITSQLLSILRPYGAKASDAPLLNHFSANAKVASNDKGHYHLRIFRIALILRHQQLRELFALFKADFAPTFFGFGGNWDLARQAILDLVSLYQSGVTDAKMEHTLNLIRYPDCDLPELESLTRLFGQIKIQNSD